MHLCNEAGRMMKCPSYITYSTGAHATVRGLMSWIPSPKPLLHPQSSQYWVLIGSQSLSVCVHRQNTNQPGKLKALYQICDHIFSKKAAVWTTLFPHIYCVIKKTTTLKREIQHRDIEHITCQYEGKKIISFQHPEYDNMLFFFVIWE